MKVSIVVPAHNESRVIRNQLEALAAQEAVHDWEVIIADNGSTDDTAKIVRAYTRNNQRMRLIDASQKCGAAHARNTGAKAADGDYLAFLDADDVADAGWLSAMCKAAERHDFLASRFDCERLNPVDNDRPNTLRGCPQTQGLQEYKYPRFLPHAGGCGLVVERSLHDRVGGFDESIRLLEDTDYCWRIQLEGTPLQFVPDALVYIRHPADARGVYRQARDWGQYNVLLYKRYQNRGMPKLQIGDGLAAWIGLLKRRPRIHSPDALAKWNWNFHWRLGRLIGSVKYRILAL